MNPRTRWLLFDVGNTLLHDDLAMVHVYRMLHQAVVDVDPSVTFPDLLTMRENLIKDENSSQPHWEIAIRYFGLDGWATLRRLIMAELDRNYEQYHRPAPGAIEMLADLQSDYRLGIAGNQVRSCRPALEKFGILKFMSLVWLSEEVGLYKPDPEFFRSALRITNCPPDRCVMIGDRLDYDIGPPKLLGMKAIQAQFSFENGLDGSDEYTRLYIESLKRWRVADVRPRGPVETPDAVITSFSQLRPAVESLLS